MFRQVPENVNVRPLIKREDLNLIRRAFIKLITDNKDMKDRDKAVTLFARMLRKAHDNS